MTSLQNTLPLNKKTTPSPLPQTPAKHKLPIGIILALPMTLAASTATGQQYVFLYRNGTTVYFLQNNNGTVQAQSNFGNYASTCIFTGNSSSITAVTTFQNGTYYLRGQRGQDYNLNLSTRTNNNTWTNNGYGKISRDNYYLRYNSGWTLTQVHPFKNVLLS